MFIDEVKVLSTGAPPTTTNGNEAVTNTPTNPVSMALVSVVVVSILTIPPNVTVFLAFEAAFIWAMYLSRVSFFPLKVMSFISLEKNASNAVVKASSEVLVCSMDVRHCSTYVVRGRMIGPPGLDMFMRDVS